MMKFMTLTKVNENTLLTRCMRIDTEMRRIFILQF